MFLSQEEINFKTQSRFRSGPVNTSANIDGVLVQIGCCAGAIKHQGLLQIHR
mgnify:FL=1